MLYLPRREITSVHVSAKFTNPQVAAAKRYDGMAPPTLIDPRVEALVTELIGRVADK